MPLQILTVKVKTEGDKPLQRENMAMLGEVLMNVLRPFITRGTTIEAVAGDPLGLISAVPTEDEIAEEIGRLSGKVSDDDLTGVADDALHGAVEGLLSQLPVLADGRREALVRLLLTLGISPSGALGVHEGETRRCRVGHATTTVEWYEVNVPVGEDPEEYVRSHPELELSEVERGCEPVNYIVQEEV